MLGKVAAERLIDQEKLNKQLSQESKELNRNFSLAQSANLNLEKKLSELAEALKRCQDEKKIADEALEQSKKDLEKFQKTHDNDLSLIENLRKTHDRSSKIAEDLRAKNADLARSLSSKKQKLQDLEKALTEQREASRKKMYDIIDRLKVLFEEYERSLNEFGIRPAPLPADLGLPEFMEWIDVEFKAFPKVISGANDFAVAFSVESILKVLHDFDCADLAKIREKLPQFPDALSTSRIRPNEDVQATRSRFARKFWLASGNEAIKSFARAKLAQVSFQTVMFATTNSQKFCPLIFLTSISLPLLAN
jgi:Rad3-related DNA helicase